jgi:hypothetical protein
MHDVRGVAEPQSMARCHQHCLAYAAPHCTKRRGHSHKLRRCRPSQQLDGLTQCDVLPLAPQLIPAAPCVSSRENRCSQTRSSDCASPYGAKSCFGHAATGCGATVQLAKRLITFRPLSNPMRASLLCIGVRLRRRCIHEVVIQLRIDQNQSCLDRHRMAPHCGWQQPQTTL